MLTHTTPFPNAYPPCGQRGFTLLEVLVAILVASIGILGITATQAIAFSSMQVASTRSLVAMQAASLASAMQGNPAYWAQGLAPQTLTITDGVIQNSTLATLPPVAGCLTSTVPVKTPLCTPTQLAALDVQNWTAGIRNAIPTASPIVVSCTTDTTAAPINCTIAISWTERYIPSSHIGTIDPKYTDGVGQKYFLQVNP